MAFLCHTERSPTLVGFPLPASASPPYLQVSACVGTSATPIGLHGWHLAILRGHRAYGFSSTCVGFSAALTGLLSLLYLRRGFHNVSHCSAYAEASTMLLSLLCLCRGFHNVALIALPTSRLPQCCSHCSTYVEASTMLLSLLCLRRDFHNVSQSSSDESERLPHTDLALLPWTSVLTTWIAGLFCSGSLLSSFSFL